MARLDTQRPPSKVHARSNARTYKRGYDSIPHPVWGDSLVVSSTITNLAPATAAIGVSGALVVTGTGFSPQSKVYFDGDLRPTTYDSPTQLTSSIATLVGPARTVQVTVSTGGSRSFTIT
jgi:hypothetical protein